MLLPHAHLPLGGRVGDAAGARAVLDYAPLDREAPLLARVGVADWGFHGVFAARGPQHAKLLGNVLTSDIAGLLAGQAQPSLLLSPKGKVAGVLRVWRHDNEHLDVLAEAPCAPAVAQVLGRYAQVGKVPWEDRSQELGAILVLGPEAEDAVRQALECDPPKPGRVALTPAGNVLAHDALASPAGFVLLVRAEQAMDAWDRLVAAARRRGGGPVGWHAVEDARVRAGVPRFGAEATAESLPGEAGLDAAVSYTKGCFVGQETVARIKHLGHVNRVAVRLRPEQPCEVGDALALDSKPVGAVTSVARGPGPPAALAVVRREHAAPGTRLALPRDGAAVTGPAQLA